MLCGHAGFGERDDIDAREGGKSTARHPARFESDFCRFGLWRNILDQAWVQREKSCCIVLYRIRHRLHLEILCILHSEFWNLRRLRLTRSLATLARDARSDARSLDATLADARSNQITMEIDAKRKALGR